MTNTRKTTGTNTIQKTIKKITTNVWENDFGFVHSFVFFASKFSALVLERVFTVRKYTFDFSLIAVVAMMGASVFYPAMANADMVTDQKFMDHKTVTLMLETFGNESMSYGSLPVAKEATPRKTFTIPITAYTSDVAQTDDTPCITASGLDVCKRNQEDIIAANFLPMGTRVRIPELYGDRIFTVHDRMNARYDKHVDVWMKEYADAKQFGLKFSKIEVF